jgi:hypothetical protein
VGRDKSLKSGAELKIRIQRNTPKYSSKRNITNTGPEGKKTRRKNSSVKYCPS